MNMTVLITIVILQLLKTYRNFCLSNQAQDVYNTHCCGQSSMTNNNDSFKLILIDPITFYTVRCGKSKQYRNSFRCLVFIDQLMIMFILERNELRLKSFCQVALLYFILNNV